LPWNNPILNPAGAILNIPSDARNAVEQLGRLFTGEQNPPMTEDAYKTSPYFRKGVPWDPGMTEDRAAVLADSFDLKTAKDYFGSKNPAAFMLGGFVGQAADPINFIPVFGEAAQAVAVAKFGGNMLADFGIRAGIGAADAALNTAVTGATTAQQRGKYGDDVSWQAQIHDIAWAALIGGILTPIAHSVGEGISALVRKRVAASVQTRMETVANAGLAHALANDAVRSLATDGEVRLTTASGATIEQLSAGIAARRDAAVLQAAEAAKTEAAAPARRAEIARAAQSAEPNQQIAVYDTAGKETPVQVVSRSPEGAVIVRDQTGAVHELDRGKYSVADPADPNYRMQSEQDAPRVADMTDEQLAAHVDNAERAIAERSGDEAGALALARDRNAATMEMQRRADAVTEKTLSDRAPATEAGQTTARPPATDMSPPRQAPPPQGLSEAAARVGQGEDAKALAAQHSLADDHSFAEEKIIDMMREQNVLSAADLAELDHADETMANARAWGEALVTAARCAFGAL
jgi:hypothetical protein